MLTRTPTVPKEITVHLGAPDSAAKNITVSFPEYIKNVASNPEHNCLCFYRTH